MSKKVLILDSDPNLIVMLEACLSVEDFEVLTVDDGIRGMEVFEKMKPDLVIVDSVLPGMSGYQVVQKIRGTSGPSRKTPIIVTSEKAQIRDLFGSQIDGFLVKPIIPEEFMGMVRETMERYGDKDDDNGPKGNSVIIIGMDPKLLEQVNSYLQVRGFEVFVLTSEIEIMNKIFEARPRLILSEFAEEPDGFNVAAFVNNLKKDPLTERIPFRLLCYEDLVLEADKEFARSVMLMFRGRDDLMKKIEKFLG